MYASISFDIDGKWSALKYFNIASDPRHDEFVERGIPKILGLLKKHNVKATFFVVGTNVKNYPALHREIVKMKHEIGNHSFTHPHDLSKKRNIDIRNEIIKTHDIIKELLKVTPVGFRAPTYNINKEVIGVLKELGYNYDSSNMPAYYPGITPFSNLLLKRSPYRIGSLIEIPVSVHPVIPFYLNGTSIIALGVDWLKSAMLFMKLTNRPIVINFHERDVIGRLPTILEKHFKRTKRDGFNVIEETIVYLKKHTNLVSMRELAGVYR